MDGTPSATASPGPGSTRASATSRNNAATASLDWKPTAEGSSSASEPPTSPTTRGAAIRIDAYTVARLYGSYQLTDHVKLHARVENALNEDYDLSSFYGTTIKGAGTGLYAGITIDW